MVKIKTDVIATFEEYGKPQQHFQVIQEIDETTSLSNIEKYWVTGCAMKVRSPQDLVKLSLCVIEDLEDAMIDVCYITNGKYYFQPDQAGSVEQHIKVFFPKIAKNTIPYKEWVLKFHSVKHGN